MLARMVCRPVLLLFTVAILTGCTQSASPSVVAAPSPSPEPSPMSTRYAAGIKAAPTAYLPETDEFGIVVRATRVSGRVSVDIDRVDMLSGDEGERAAAADGQDYSDDYYL